MDAAQVPCKQTYMMLGLCPYNVLAFNRKFQDYYISQCSLLILRLFRAFASTSAGGKGNKSCGRWTQWRRDDFIQLCSTSNALSYPKASWSHLLDWKSLDKASEWHRYMHEWRSTIDQSRLTLSRRKWVAEKANGIDTLHRAKEYVIRTGLSAVNRWTSYVVFRSRNNTNDWTTLQRSPILLKKIITNACLVQYSSLSDAEAFCGSRSFRSLCLWFGAYARTASDRKTSSHRTLGFSAFFRMNVFLYRFRFRVKCHQLCNHPHYCNVILGCILISSAMLAAEDPLVTKTDRNQVK